MSILITGANKNLGATLSLELAKLGYDLVLVYDKDDNAKEKCVNKLNSVKARCKKNPELFIFA